MKTYVRIYMVVLITLVLAVKLALAFLELGCSVVSSSKQAELEARGWTIEYVNQKFEFGSMICEGLTQPDEKHIIVVINDDFALAHELGHAYSFEFGEIVPDHDTTPVWYMDRTYMHTDSYELSANAYVEQWLLH